MNRLAISTADDELEASAEFCRAEGIGMELTAFAFPFNIKDDMTALVHRCRNVVEGISPLSIHGPFIDLIATSPDLQVVSLARQRHETTISIALDLGVSHYVAHTNYMPMIRIADYHDNWIKSMLEFWLPLADKAGKKGMVICLENMWEPSPYVQEELISLAGHPHLRATFDNGHALIFSNFSSKTWVETLGSNIAHCHLHDNFGELDDHRTIGDGKENWPTLIETVRTNCPEANLISEGNRLKENKQNINLLKRLTSHSKEQTIKPQRLRAVRQG